MKKLFFVLLVVVVNLNVFSQMQVSNLNFIFEQKTTFTEQFLDKENSKQFNLTIEGINSELNAQALVHMVKEMRGVEDFKLEISDVENIYNAKLKVYKYATGWWYWKNFMQKVGVSHFKIENISYTATQVAEIN